MTGSRTHECEPLSALRSGAGSYRITVKWSEGAWQLCYASYAIEQNVRAGEAEAAGEWMGGVDLAIYFCPYCGVALPPQDD